MLCQLFCFSNKKLTQYSETQVSCRQGRKNCDKINHKEVFFMDDDQPYPPPCPQCKSENIEIHRESEYTGGGYADYWDEYECLDCGNIRRSDKDTGMY